MPNAASLSAQGTGAAPFPSLTTRSLPKTAIGQTVHSLDAVIGGVGLPAAASSKEEAVETEEELFALPMSPRSPEMKRSPFSLL